MVLARMSRHKAASPVAGTYTPLCLVGLESPVRERLLATIWGGAALGLLQVRRLLGPWGERTLHSPHT